MICFRNPIQKEFSAYLFGQRNGGNDFSFKEGLNNGYLDPSKCLYGKFLQEYLSVFPRDNLLVLFFDDLESDPQGFAKQLFDFIGVEELHDYSYSRKVLPASRPRLKVIAKLIKLVAVVARGMGLLSFLGMAKRSSFIHKLIYSEMNDVEKPKISREDHCFLAEYFRQDVELLSSLTGRNLDHWLSYDD